MEIAKFVLQAVGVFLALAGLFYTILSSWMKKKEKELEAIKTEMTSAVSRILVDLKVERNNRVENVNRVHARIDNMQSELISDLQSRMSRMEGELLGMKNILTQIQGWFIDQASK